MDNAKQYNKLDTFSETIYMVKLSADPKAYIREDKTLDVVLSFVDTSRFDNHIEMWVDARVLRGQSDRASRFRKGDQVMIRGKMRYKQNPDTGKVRGKIFDAFVSSFVSTADREPVTPQEPNEVTFSE